MAAYGILFQIPNPQPLGEYGGVLKGAYWKFYYSKGLVPAKVYADGALTTQLSQVPGTAQPSCTADAFGRFNPIYLDPTAIYRAQLFTAMGQERENVDPYVVPANFSALQGTSGTGTLRLTDSVNTESGVAFAWFLSAGNEMCTLQVASCAIASATTTLSLQYDTGQPWPPMIQGFFETGDSYHSIPATNNNIYITAAARIGLQQDIQLEADPTVGLSSWTTGGGSNKGLPVGFTITYPIQGISDGP